MRLDRPSGPADEPDRPDETKADRTDRPVVTRHEERNRLDEEDDLRAALDARGRLTATEPSQPVRHETRNRIQLRNDLQAAYEARQANRAEAAARAGAAENPEPESASEGDDKPEKQREFKTLAEEFGESRPFSTFDAARRTSIREHGPRPGQDLHHLVERSQARPERSGFTQEQIHSSDNLGWLDRPVHEKITARYNKGIPGFSRLRDSLDGLPFETQHAFGRSVVDEEMRKYRGDD